MSEIFDEGAYAIQYLRRSLVPSWLLTTVLLRVLQRRRKYCTFLAAPLLFLTKAIAAEFAAQESENNKTRGSSDRSAEEGQE